MGENGKSDKSCRIRPLLLSNHFEDEGIDHLCFSATLGTFQQGYFIHRKL